MAGLPWLPSSVVDTTDEWDWQNTVSSAVGQIAQAGQDLMRPVGQHVASVMQSVQPAPTLPTPNVTPELPEVKPFSLGSIEDWGFGASSKPQQPTAPESSAAQPVTHEAGTFKLPDPGAFFVMPGASAGPATGPDGGPAPTRGAPAYGQGSWDRRAYDAAVAAGHPDPVEFVEQMRQESQFDPDVISGKRSSSAGAQGIAQIMPATAKAWGVNPLDPHAALAAAAKAMTGYYKTYGSSDQALAAYNMGPGNLQKYGPRGLAETAQYLEIIQGKARAAQKVTQTPTTPPQNAETSVRKGESAPNWGTYTPETLTPNQLSEGTQQGLTTQQALAICGPAAAVAFSRANGRNPTLAEAKGLAERLGLWDEGAGMHGPASQVTLLENMGIQSRLAEGADWGAIAREVQAGRPVIVDTPSHYYTVTAAHPDGTFEFGQSAGVLAKSGGRTRFRPEEIPSLGMGAPRATIYMGRGS